MPNETGDAAHMLDRDLDQPATRRDLLALETGLRADQETTRSDLRALETAMRADLLAHQETTRRDLIAHQEATREALFALEARVDKRFEDLGRHFDVVAESFTTQFGHLFDWTETTTSTLGERVDRLEQNHQTRVGSLELRMTRLERRRKRR